MHGELKLGETNSKTLEIKVNPILGTGLWKNIPDDKGKYDFVRQVCHRQKGEKYCAQVLLTFSRFDDEQT